MKCLGCLLANNEIETYVVYEDDIVNVILDKFPFSYGHILIMPKEHYESMDDIPLDVYTHIMAVAQKLKPVLMSAFKCTSVILLQNNGAMNSLKHYHLHLIPHSDEDLSTLYDTSQYQDNSDIKLSESLSKIKSLM